MCACAPDTHPDTPPDDRRSEQRKSYLASGSAGLGRALLRTSLGVSGILALDVCVTVAVAVLLARNLGVTGLGLYSIGIAAGHILTPLVQLGLPRLMAREINRANALDDGRRLSGLLRFGAGVLATFAAAFALLCLAAWPLVGAAVPDRVEDVLLPALLLTPLAASVNIAGGALQGFQRVTAATVVKTLAPGAAMLALAGAAALLTPGWLTPGRAVMLNVIAAALVLAGAAIILAPCVMRAWRGARPVYRASEWMRSAFRFALTSGLVIAEQHLLILVLGAAANEAQTTFFRIAQRTANLANLGYATVIRVIGPGISESYARGDAARLQQFIRQGARGMAATTILVLILLTIAGEWLIEIAFGADFIPAYLPLILLCAAWSLRAIFGPVELLMVMTGNEHSVLRARLLSMVVIVGGAALLAAPLGALGAAIAAGLGYLTLSLTLWRGARRRLGCATTALGY